MNSAASSSDASGGNLSSILSSGNRDFLISPSGDKVSVEELEGKTIGLYFGANWYAKCEKFNLLLAEVYLKLKEQGAGFEVVFVSCDEDQSSFEQFHGTMPWVAIPFADLQSKKFLNQRYGIEGIPSLVILSPTGQLLQTEGVELIHHYGSRAFPFTPTRISELVAEEKADHDSQTLEKLLATTGRDFVIDHGKEVPISNFVGKTIGLLFSAQSYPPCAKFTSRLASIYKNLKEKHDRFEIVFVSVDKDESSYSQCFSEMPWIALPYNMESTKLLSRYFNIQGIPALVIIGPDGKTLTKEGRNLINLYMEMAYPFTEERLKLLREKMDEEAKSYPRSLSHEGHRHALNLVSENSGGGPYICCECEEQGFGWAYQCLRCGYEIHRKCVREVEENGSLG
ncbi:probable nucleoredoxin 2 [Phalaenopsis equestris]|uniref:probable nucleoredoxin 2 n=1 Tax=Phalaenopsis equestris TaxID=78828 RepID=UPI0009E61F28|nr:probable nucleoredoxin 2 [Phalaenopsis equestris]